MEGFKGLGFGIYSGLGVEGFRVCMARINSKAFLRRGLYYGLLVSLFKRQVIWRFEFGVSHVPICRP